MATALIWLGGALVAGTALLALYVVVIWLRLPDVETLAERGDPGETAFMREDSCAEIERAYARLEEIDPIVACTFIWAEDWRFFEHDGIDEQAIKWALKKNWEARAWRYGGSTIPMQLARNLYLSRSRTLSRKGKELALARRLVAAHDRRRLLELYLNVTELAPCVYGVEAAARHYFGHGANVLDAAEATFLAAMLPRPGRLAGSSDADRVHLVERQQKLLTRLWRARLLTRAETRRARAEVVAGWRDGWIGHRPLVTRPAPAGWYERGCGTLRWAKTPRRPTKRKSGARPKSLGREFEEQASSIAGEKRQ